MVILGLLDSDILFGGSSLLRLLNALSPRHLTLVPPRATNVEQFMKGRYSTLFFNLILSSKYKMASSVVEFGAIKDVSNFYDDKKQ